LGNRRDAPKPMRLTAAQRAMRYRQRRLEQEVRA